jgi:natural product biosynthesis luciferase-like monooxygenase protein
MPAESSYPLSPVQQGMLYHHLTSPNSGVDVEQMVAVLQGPIDVAALRRAWDWLVNRHAAFRCSFAWEDRPHPVHVEHPHVIAGWEEVDLRGHAPDKQRGAIDVYLHQDRQRGLDFQSAPLSRAILFQTRDDVRTLVWTFHHILADGNSYPALLREVFTCYDALRDGREFTLPPPRPYREFIGWLGNHLADIRPRAEAFWRERLRGFRARTPLPGVSTDRAEESGRDEKELRLSAAATTVLAEFARASELTMNTLVQGAWALALGAYSGEEDVVFGETRSCRRSALAGADEIIGVLINTAPVRVRLRPEATVLDWLKELRASQKAVREFEHTPLVDVQRWSEVPPGTPLFESLVVFTPRLVGAALKELGGVWANREIRFVEQTNYPITLFAYNERELLLKLAYDRSRCSDAGIQRCLELLETLLITLPQEPGRRLAELPLVSASQRQVLIQDWNATARAYEKERCVHELFEAQVARTPAAPAVVFREQSQTYQELNDRANQLAGKLRSLGVGPGKLVGVFLKRSPELVAALLATLKAGAAYVPMDPAYPSKRLGWMLEDSNAAVVLTQRDLCGALPATSERVLCIDEEGLANGRGTPSENVVSGVRPDDLAYVIFTSGSSGRPKGVMVEHRNVTNYFTGMDECLDFKEPGTWLAVTSVSFDISVHELFWSLARGFKVVLQEEPERSTVAPAAGPHAQKMEFSLFYFAADSGGSSEYRYRLLTEGARFADQHGFTAVWTPERHFHAFGGLYPNPSLTSAVIAAITSRVQIRAGSVVLPLHNPIRVAEEWSVVDNLSQGRVGLSFASGWHANDFALLPENYRDRKEVMLRGIDTVRRLWRGEPVEATSGTGEPTQVRLFPAPVQREPQIWLTSAGNVETFRTTGRLGFNVLTNLLGQEPADLAEKIAAYRAALREHGHPGEGHVTLMLHTFVGSDLDEVRRKVRTPFLQYLKTSTDLIKKARWECPAFATSPNRRLTPVEDDRLTEEEEQVIMDHAFERYFKTSGLFGTPETCTEMVDRLKAIGVNEIACLIDFGVENESVLEGLRHLDELRRHSNPPEDGGDYSIPTQVRRHGVTHLQCTPSLARMLASESDSLNALRPLRKWMVGGEAFPPSLAAELAAAIEGDVINVYGPTESTVWSTTARLDRAGGPVTIGRPIANTQIYLLDRHRRPTPIGVPGELCIGGDGVTRGYLNRPDLTDERFIPDTFGPNPKGRLYRTGDLARYREDGRIEFLGRLDFQVKIRGYRIELGEIEAALASHPAVRECVVVAREQAAGVQSLVAYVAARSSPATQNGSTDSWRDLWDATYSGATNGAHAPADPTLNTTGWLDSYTGQLIPEPEMRAWVGHTVERILAQKPRRVLEIGCGTGMLLFRVAPHCEHYLGVDFSETALRSVQAEVDRQGLRNVTLRQAAADRLPELPPGSLDLVVLNSVVQYFPNAEYLVGVLERVAPLVKEGGAIFLGDVRNLPLLEAFHNSVALEQAPDSLSVEELRQRVRRRLERDNELVLDPAFFRALPQHFPKLRRVEVQLKRGHYHNELTRFRYDVVLRVGGPVAPASTAAQVPGNDITLAKIREHLATGAPVVSIASIPNPRVAHAVRAAELLSPGECAETVAAIRQSLDAVADTGIDPEDLYALEIPYEVELGWSDGALDCFDVVFRQRSMVPAGLATSVNTPRKAWSEYTNRPGTATDPTSLALELKQLAKERLPDYMVPATVLVLESLPRTPNGKIDRKALPQPGVEAQPTATAYVAPSSDLERTISSVWQELLQVERVGAHDNFFDLGANSLLMVQASSRLRTALRRELSLVDLFRFPTVSALANHLGPAGEEKATLAQSQERGRARLDALQRRRPAPRPGQVKA